MRVRSGGRSGTAAPTTASTVTGAAGEGAARRRRGLPGPGEAGPRWRGRSQALSVPSCLNSLYFHPRPPPPPPLPEELFFLP